MTAFGSPDYWRQRQAAVSKAWWEKWLPSLDSDLTLDAALSGSDSFVLLRRDIGTDLAQRLAAGVADRKLIPDRVFILAPPYMLRYWEETFLKAGVDVAGMSIFRVANWNQRNREVALSGRLVVVEAPVSDKTKTKERLQAILHEYRTIVYTRFDISPPKPPRDLSTALKIVNRGRAPVPVVWEPPIEGDLPQRLFRTGLVGSAI